VTELAWATKEGSKSEPPSAMAFFILEAIPPANINKRFFIYVLKK